MRERRSTSTEPGYEESAGVPIIASDNSWNGDGTKLVALIAAAGDVKVRPRIVVIEFREPL